MIFLRKNSTFILFLLVLAVAIFFRFWKISTIPYGLNNDAAWEGSAALAILGGNFADYLPYAAEGWRGEGIIRAFVAFLMLFFGNDPITIRLSTVIFGVGLVVAIFFLIRNFFGDKLAILTSFFIAISGWHITFSKTGWRAVTVPFFTTLIFYFFFKGLGSKKFVPFILSGIFLSIASLYTYDAARAVPLFFIFWLFFESITRKSFIKTYFKHLVVLFLSCFVVSLPMILYAYNNWQNFISRSDFLFVGNEMEKVGNFSPLINNITTSMLLFNVKANGNDFFIFDPLIDKPLSYLFPIGFSITLFFVVLKRNKKYFFMLTWFLVSLVPGLLSVPNGNRAIGTIPSVYFFAALVLAQPLAPIFRYFTKYKFWYFLIILIFCSYSLLLTYQNYLGPNRRELAGFYPETLVTTNYIKTIWNDYEIYLTDSYPRELLTYYLYRNSADAFAKNYTWLESSTAFLNLEINQTLAGSNNYQNILGESTSINKKGLAFFMFATPENESIAKQLMKKYPKSNKFLLWYNNDNIIKRPASLVILIPRR